MQTISITSLLLPLLKTLDHPNILHIFVNLIVISHFFASFFGNIMSIPLSTLLIIKSPRSLRLLNPNLITILITSQHIFLHLPQLYIRIVNHNQRLAFFHSLHCSKIVSLVVFSYHLHIVNVFTIHHKEIIC